MSVSRAALEEELAVAAAEYKPNGAVGIITNVHTGEIVAMASWPDFDPNFQQRATPDQKLNRAAASVFEMGSTFKAFTVAIGLDTRVAKPDSTYDARAPLKIGYRTIHDYHGENRILTLREVFNHSSNIGTALLAHAIGNEQLARYFAAFGLTSRAQVELIESARPLTPKKWNDDDIASVSFGHGINVSPLTLAQAMGAILNGGQMVPLTIRKAAPGFRPQGPRVVSEATTLSMLQIMRGNVVGGTGRKAEAAGLSVGGKTGTGEKWDSEIRSYSSYKQVGSFAAVFPTDGPVEADRYFVLVLLDEPKGGIRTGGWVAGAGRRPHYRSRRALPRRASPADARARRADPDRRAGDRHDGDAGGRPVTALLSRLIGRPVTPDPLITGVTADSRKVAPGFLFAALPGSKVDGRAYVESAVASGAAAILAPDDVRHPAVPVVHAEDLRRAYALAAAALYGVQPAICVAVTGTNGKTSVATFCRQIFASLGRKAASMGTLGVTVSSPGVPDVQITPPGLTTPDAADVAELMAKLAADGVTHVALEASSHGVDQRRLDGVRLTAAGFLNLTQDHLDYHGTMGVYRAAKLRLFETLLPAGGTAVLNADSDQFGTFADAATAAGHPVFSTGEAGKGLHIAGRRLTADGQQLSIEHDGRRHDLHLPLAGAFQADNALVAAGLCIAAGEDAGAVLRALEELKGRPRPPAACRRGPARRRRLCRLRPYARRAGDRSQGAAATHRRPPDRGVRRRRRPRSGQATVDGRDRRPAGRRRDRHRRQSPLRDPGRDPRRNPCRRAWRP
jgi:hypothetical protein